MSRVHDAMRNLEHKSTPDKGSVLSSLVGALIEELAHEIPDEPQLEAVRADLLAASRSYESDKKKDLALRYYLAIRALLREYALLQERVKKAEKKSLDSEHFAAQDRRPEVRTLESLTGPHPDSAIGHHA
jgi:hypothetical protein